MKKWLLFSAALAVMGGSMPVNAENEMKPPVAKKVPHRTQVHGYERVDHYHWMRDRNEPRAQEILDYLKAENAYTEQVMKPYHGLVDRLYQEMLGRIQEDDTSVPFRKGDYYYFSETEKGKQYPVYKRARQPQGAPAEVLLDQNELAKGHAYFSIRQPYNVSPDGNWLAFSTDTNGYRQYRLQFKNLKTGEVLPQTFERVTSVAWAADSQTVFFSTEDEVDKRSQDVFRYRIGQGQPVKVYHEADALFSSHVGLTRDRQFLLLVSSAATMTEVRILSSKQPAGEFRLVLAREQDHEYSVDHWNGALYLTTNKGAENFRVVKAPLADPKEKNWVDFLPHNPAIKIEGIDFFKDYAVVSELERGLEYLKVLDLRGKKPPVRIPTREEVYTLSLGNNPEFESTGIQFNYASMVTPNSTFEYDLATGEQRLLKQQVLPSGHDPGRYETRRVWATARDGVKVPISLLMKKGTQLDGESPMLLYAYGSYGASMTPYFSSSRLSLVDRGMTYAIAHIRGGSELGEGWRLDGRMFKKMNTFHDFIDSARWLIEEKYTSPDRLVIQGGSAGGLLMGVVMNQAPELFKAALVQVPFVDVLNTMLDETLPLTTGEWIEWGNPNEKAAYDYMASYSPYDNIKAQAYPNMMVQISLYDSQVLYWEGAKYAAKVREHNTGNSKILLKTNMAAGHGGASGRYDRLKEIALDYAYALSQVGLAGPD